MENKITNTGYLIAIVLLVILGVAGRLSHHIPNFTPLFGIILFSAYFFPKKIAIILPISIMLISDILLGFYSFKIMLFVYFSIALVSIFGLILKKQKKLILVLSLFSPFIFFIITNFGFWLLTPFYQKTFLGLTRCYAMALPFFKNSLLSSIFYSFAIFSAYELFNFILNKKYIKTKKCEFLNYKN